MMLDFHSSKCKFRFCNYIKYKKDKSDAKEVQDVHSFLFTIIFQLFYRMSYDNQCFKSFDIKVLLYLTYYLQ